MASKKATKCLMNTSNINEEIDNLSLPQVISCEHHKFDISRLLWMNGTKRKKFSLLAIKKSFPVSCPTLSFTSFTRGFYRFK